MYQDYKKISNGKISRNNLIHQNYESNNHVSSFHQQHQYQYQSMNSHKDPNFLNNRKMHLEEKFKKLTKKIEENFSGNKGNNLQKIKKKGVSNKNANLNKTPENYISIHIGPAN